MKDTLLDTGYKDWLVELKQKVRSEQLKAAVAVNTALIGFYFELGKSIAEKQTAWGTGFLRQLSQDLRSEFPNMEGFSETNLRYCRLFYRYLQVRPQVEDELKFKSAVAVNNEIILQYWESGKVIAENEYTWGGKFLPQLEKARSFVFPHLRGFSEHNRKCCRQFYQFHSLPFWQRPVAQLAQHSYTLAAEVLNKDKSEQKAFSQHAVDQIPRGHNILIFTKSKDMKEAYPPLKRLKMN